MKHPDETTEAENRGEIIRKSRLQTREDRVDRIFHTLARLFNGLHWGVGITALPKTASRREERSFVFMWLGIIVFMLLFFAIMIRLL
jgi:hypothetical protein